MIIGNVSGTLNTLSFFNIVVAITCTIELLYRECTQQLHMNAVSSSQTRIQLYIPVSELEVQ